LVCCTVARELLHLFKRCRSAFLRRVLSEFVLGLPVTAKPTAALRREAAGLRFGPLLSRGGLQTRGVPKSQLLRESLIHPSGVRVCVWICKSNTTMCLSVDSGFSLGSPPSPPRWHRRGGDCRFPSSESELPLSPKRRLVPAGIYTPRLAVRVAQSKRTALARARVAQSEQVCVCSA